jgi:hypothetical protein
MAMKPYGVAKNTTKEGAFFLANTSATMQTKGVANESQ